MTKTHQPKSAVEKLAVLKQSEKEGVVETARLYDLHPSLVYHWKKKYDEGGIEALKDKRLGKEAAQVKKLEKENSRLKMLLGERTLELDIKEDLLKKVRQRLKSEEELSDDSSLWVE